MDIISNIVALGGWVVSVITSIITFVVAKHKRHDEDIVLLNKRIVDLLEKNDHLIKEIVELREENAQLRSQQKELQLEIETLRKKINKSHGKQSTKKA